MSLVVEKPAAEATLPKRRRWSRRLAVGCLALALVAAGGVLSQVLWNRPSPAEALTVWSDRMQTLQMVGETKAIGGAQVTLMEIVTLPSDNSLYLHFFVVGNQGEVLELQKASLDGKANWIGLGDLDNAPSGFGNRGINDTWQQIRLLPGAPTPKELTATAALVKFGSGATIGTATFQVTINADFGDNPGG